MPAPYSPFYAVSPGPMVSSHGKQPATEPIVAGSQYKADSCMLCLILCILFLWPFLSHAVSDTARCRQLEWLIEQEPDEKVWRKYHEEMRSIVDRRLFNCEVSDQIYRVYNRYRSVVLNNQAILCMSSARIDSAILLTRQSLAIREQLGDKRGIGESLNNLGTIYNRKGDMLQAIRCLLRSLEIQESIGDSIYMTSTLLNLAVLFNDLDDTARASVFAQRGLVMQSALNDTSGMAFMLNLTGSLEAKKGHYDKALKKLLQGLLLRQQISDKLGQAYSQLELGKLFQAMGMRDSALARHQAALVLMNASGDKEGKMVAGKYYAHLLCTHGQIPAAREVAGEALTLARSLGYPGDIMQIARILYEVARKLGDTGEALSMLELYEAMRDSTRSDRVKLEVARAELRLDYEKKATADSMTTVMEKRELAAGIEKQKTQRNYAILAGLAVLAVSIAVFSRYKLAGVVEKGRLLQQISEMKMERLRSQMNPHFIFNALNAINRYIIRSDKETASDYLVKFSKLMRLVLENSRSNTVTLASELEAVKLYVEMEQLRFDQKFSYSVEVGPGVESGSMHIPPLVFQPYIENAIWHGLMPKGSPGLVKLSIDRQGEYLHCAIEDDGIGREKATAMRSSTLGHKRSWGMQITSERLKFQNGEASGIHIIDLHDVKGQAAGTRVEITIKFT